MNERLATGGLRSTPQREHVYSMLLQKPDHPTAEEVFIRVKREMPDISLATVYNCLDALVRCGLVRQVTVERGAARFCPNMREHGHFCCDACGGVCDVELPVKTSIPLPKGYRVDRFDVVIHGACPACGRQNGVRG